MADQGETEVRKTNVKIFLEHMKQKFARILDTICPDRNASKDLVTVSEIRPLFELIIDTQTLKDRKVSLVWLNEQTIQQYSDPDVQKIIFFVPPTYKYVQLIKKFHRMLKKKNYDKKLYLVYYPKRTLMCKYFMDQEKILVLFENSTYDFNFDLIPLFNDLLSLEYKPALSEMFVSAEYTCYNLVAESILRLQMVFGKVPSFLIKGDKARIVFEILGRLQKEHGNSLAVDQDVREVDAVIIMDRSVDLLTPFVTQLTYQGIIDENIGIEINKVIIDKKIPFPKDEDGPQDGNANMNLYLTDPIFDAIKDLRIAEAGKLLREKLFEYQDLIKNRDANANDLKYQLQLSNEIKKKRFVEPHINIATYLRQNIQTKLVKIEQECLFNPVYDEFFSDLTDLILKKEDVYSVFRLLCLYSLADGGFKGIQYETIKKEIIETYGFEHMNTFNLLSQAEILYNKDTKKLKSIYATFKKSHKLFNENYETEDPKRKSFPYNAYTPLTVKIVENAFRQTWTGGDLVDKVPGFYYTEGDPRNAAGTKTTRKVVALYMVGGLTYAEISCLRYVAKLYNIELLIATTNIVNYRRMLEPFIE